MIGSVAQPPRYMLLSARGASTRTTLDLLSLSLPFTQTRLLDPADLVAEADKRRVRLDLSQLEVLHRARLLVPFFSVSLTSGDQRCVVDFNASRTPEIATSTHNLELYRAAHEGRATDPRLTPFRPWPTRRVRALWPQRSRGYLYSWHQLLALRWLEPVLGAMRLDRATRRWSLPQPGSPPASDIATADSWRGLAVTLAAVDARYWPAIEQVIRYNADVWREYNLGIDPVDMLGWTGLRLEDIVGAADQLRHQAAAIDVTGAFYDIVRRAEPDAWSTMRGEALVAIDYRKAAEALDALADDLGRSSSEIELRSTARSAERLSVRRRSVDAVLTDLGVSPHPSLVAGVEGATESLIVPRVFAQLGIPVDDNWIRIVEFGGSDKDLANLAKFAAAPRLGEDHGDFVELDRPITRFLVLVDAEGRYYATKEKRARQRLRLLDAIAASLPPDLRPDLYGKEAYLVEVRTWGKLPFEFAHFTDRQLAAAVESAAATPHPSGREGLIAGLAAQRSRPSPNIERLWERDKWPDSRLSKVAVAEALWPILERKIEAAIASGSSGPPIMRAAVRAWELASMPKPQEHGTPTSRALEASPTVDAVAASCLLPPDAGEPGGRSGIPWLLTVAASPERRSPLRRRIVPRWRSTCTVCLAASPPRGRSFTLKPTSNMLWRG